MFGDDARGRCSGDPAAVSRFLVAEQRPDEEAVVDQGRTSNVVNIHYEKEELEGQSRLFPLPRGPCGAARSTAAERGRLLKK